MKKQTSLLEELDCVAEIVYKPLGDKGEDAFSYSFQKKTIHTQAVFDGCGGAGAWRYSEYNNASGAFVSAHSMAELYLEWFNSSSENDFDSISSAASEFHDVSSNKLIELKKSCQPMELSGSLVKSFPSTAAIAIIRKSGEESIELSTMWTGDSRVYFLTPREGLIQVTEDDSRGHPDPMESLRENPPLSDMLNADKAYRIKTERLIIRLPCAVICSTDGAFGYYRSPMDFENNLLSCITQAKTISDFEARLKDSVKKVTGDDSTLLMSFYGWGSFENIRKTLLPRHDHVRSIIDRIESQPTIEDSEKMMYRIWEGYSKQTLFYNMQE